jgi:hypothetical protein
MEGVTWWMDTSARVRTMGLCGPIFLLDGVELAVILALGIPVLAVILSRSGRGFGMVGPE